VLVIERDHNLTVELRALPDFVIESAVNLNTLGGSGDRLTRIFSGTPS